MKQTIKLVLCAILFSVVLSSGTTPKAQANTQAQSIECLAKGIYFESGNQPELGKQAVAWVILNRGNSWNMSVCEVVHHKLGGKCQFIWHCQANGQSLPDNRNARRSYVLAKDMIENPEKYTDVTKGAKFFHASYVSPKWKSKRKFTVKIGQHLFYQ